MPPSSHAYSNADSRSMMAGVSAQTIRIVHEIKGGSDQKMMKEIIRNIRTTVFDAGGTVQDVLGCQHRAIGTLFKAIRATYRGPASLARGSRVQHLEVGQVTLRPRRTGLGPAWRLTPRL